MSLGVVLSRKRLLKALKQNLGFEVPVI